MSLLMYSCQFSHFRGQCEAVVHYLRLFQKYLFPVLINSVFLNLVDVFTVGNKFLRLKVTKVCAKSY
uniref:Integrator complex subunit 7 N-terminal domain-containing protein n=1 Tax=Anser cygnoides TaxID=8845 RepID=A0A8B9ETI6_ANSCY